MQLKCHYDKIKNNVISIGYCKYEETDTLGVKEIKEIPMDAQGDNLPRRELKIDPISAKLRKMTPEELANRGIK